jgi:formylglycine-generating enzyme required for sulfatase activity
MLVVALILVGGGVGAGGGYAIIQRQRALQQQKLDDAAKAAALKATEDKAAAEKAEQERLATEKAAAEQKEKDRLAAEAAQAKTPAEKAAAEQAERDRLAAEKAANAEKGAAAKAEQERLAAEKAAAAKAEKERLAAEKAAADKAAKEKAAQAALVTPAPVKTEGCPDGMRPVAAGAFKMGTPPNDQMMAFDEKALTSVDVGGYCIDTFEYPNKRGVAPMAAVAWADAKRLCETQGKRLCTEAEWEKSCKGPGGARWPYGSGFDANACNTEDDVGDPRALAPSGRFAKCRSGYGVADLSGNVGEWTTEKIVKGGSYASSDYAVRCSARKQGGGGSKNSEVGFRCCSDLR